MESIGTNIEKKTILSKIVFVINIALIFLSCYFFVVLSAKYFFKVKNFSRSEKIFKYTNLTKWHFLALLEQDKKEEANSLVELTDNNELKGIYFWKNDELDKAAQAFENVENNSYSGLVSYKQNKFDEASKSVDKTNDLLLKSYLLVDNKKYSKALANFLKLKHDSGLFKIFLQLKNYPTAIYYLLKQHDNFKNLVAKLLQSKDLIQSKEETKKFIAENSTKMGWFQVLSGNFEEFIAKKTIGERESLSSLYLFLTGDFDSFVKMSNTKDFDSLILSSSMEDNRAIITELSKQYPDLKMYDIVPENIKDNIELDSTNFLIFALGFGLLIVIFVISILFLYRRYQFDLVLQRHKDLEKMDALSIAKRQQMEAKKKRDKTELNISSFITLNIQVEVLDIAYTKLGLRVNPAKLAEQMEKTKIPNISYKIYTVSNTYGLKVKMLSVRHDELAKHQKSGIVLLVLKGDLIALLKNADSQNAFLQFSDKDSRKVPFSALKLSWEGNIIILNL